MQSLELVALSFPDQLVPQPRHHAINDGERPLAIELALGGRRNGRLEQIGSLTDRYVEREDFQAAASSLGAGSVPFVQEEVLQCRQQKRSKTPSLGPGLREIILLEKTRKKRLCQVLGFV